MQGLRNSLLLLENKVGKALDIKQCNKLNLLIG